MLADIVSFWEKFKLSGSPALPAIVQKRVGPNWVQKRFSPIVHSLNTDPDLGFGSASSLNFDPNLGPVQVGSGSNRGSEPNIGITSRFTRIRVDEGEGCSGVWYIQHGMRCQLRRRIARRRNLREHRPVRRPMQVDLRCVVEGFFSGVLLFAGGAG